MKAVEGLTRCWCGCKYWDGNVCHSCGEKYCEEMDQQDRQRQAVSLQGMINAWAKQPSHIVDRYLKQGGN